MEDLRAALSNATERGARIEDAVESLIRAGYSRDDVLAAAKSLRGTVYVDITAAPTIETLTAKPPEQFPKPVDPNAQLPHGRRPHKIFLLLAILALLAAAGGIVFYLVKNYILSP